MLYRDFEAIDFLAIHFLYSLFFWLISFNNFWLNQGLFAFLALLVISGKFLLKI